MKVAFISDIHGNATALDAVLADIERKNIDEIVVLGDLCYRGPEPKRALKLIQSLEAKVIKGNADEWVVRGVRDGEVPAHLLEMMNKERDWTVARLADDDIDYLKHLPTSLELSLSDHIKVHAFHATPNSLFEVVLPDAKTEDLQQRLMSDSDSTLYMYAHIHLPYVRYMQGKCLVNLGSVGLPFDGLPHASYALVEAEDDRFRVTIERVSYDTNKVVQQYKADNYPNLELMRNVVKNGTSPF